MIVREGGGHVSPVGVLFALALLLVPTTVTAARGRPGVRPGRSAVVAGVGRPFAAHARPPRSVFPTPVDPWKSWPPHAGPRRGAHFPVVPFGGAPLVSSTLVVPDSYAPAFVTPPAEGGDLYVPAPVVPAPPAAPPVPALVEYADGWYQLRGDGVAEPYRWVWIPKPPPTSPPASFAPPATPAPRAERPAGDKPSVAYHWTDEGGVTIWTNRLDRVPKRYRDRAVQSAQPE